MNTYVSKHGQHLFMALLIAVWYAATHAIKSLNAVTGQRYKNSVALVREQTIPTERPPLVDEVSANFCE
jgi:hypothetical protein